MSSSLWKPMRRAEGGFTLLEIVISLAIAALGIAAVAKATGAAATVATETRERMLAVWVAGNHLSELRITRAWPSAGSYDLVRSMGGRTWYLTQAVSPTRDQDLRRVDITVYTDEERDEQEFAMYGFVARHRTPEELGAGQEAVEEQEGANDGEEAQPGEEAPPGTGARQGDAGDGGDT